MLIILSYPYIAILEIITFWLQGMLSLFTSMDTRHILINFPKCGGVQENPNITGRSSFLGSNISDKKRGLAHRGWNAASFANAFCAKSSGSRICKVQSIFWLDLEK